MTSKNLKAFPKPVGALQVRIQEWRSGEVSKHRMPQELWEEAVRLAKRYGVNVVSRSLALGYVSLKQKVQGNWGPVKRKSPVPGFVDITASSVASRSVISSNEIELHRPDGHWVVIRNADAACVSRVASAFFGEARCSR